MTQTNLPVMTSPTSGAQLVSNLENWRDALHSTHSGTVRPDYVLPQMMWIDTSTTPWVLKVFQGSDDIVLGSLDPVTLNFTPSAVDGGTVTGMTAGNVSATNTNGLTSTNVQGQLDELATDPYATYPIGVPFPVTHGSLIPSNVGTRKFVILSAGATGAGQYNEGLLVDSTGGTFPTNTAVGTISVGALTGVQYELMNSTRRAVIGGETQGVENDQMQVITGSTMFAADAGLIRTSGGTVTGAIIRGTSRAATAGGGTGAASDLGFDSSSSPNARTGTYTRGRGWVIPHYMRIV